MRKLLFQIPEQGLTVIDQRYHSTGGFNSRIQGWEYTAVKLCGDWRCSVSQTRII